ncbi:hypothetical protein TWF281_006824 [Arthrobotrys megalospora]
MWFVKPLVVNILEWIFASVATAFVLLRFYMRNRNARFEGYKLRNCRFRLSDWIISLTLLCFYLSNLSDTATIVIENGVDAMNLIPNPNDPKSAYNILPPHKLKTLLKILFASLFPYYGSWWGVKFYLIVLYYKLVPQATLPKHRMVLHGLAVLTVASCVGMVGTNVFWCKPIWLNWDVQPMAAGRRQCIAYFSSVVFIVTISMHIATEVLIFSFPFSFLYFIKRKNKQKFYAAAGMFAAGFIGVVISVSRVAYIFNTHYTPIIGIINAWGALEQSVGIIVCCLPAFKALLRRRFNKISATGDSRAQVVGSSTFNSGYRYNGGSSRAESKSDYGGSSVASTSAHLGSGRRGSVMDRESAILRVDSFERMEAIAEAEAARVRAAGGDGGDGGAVS